jgi:hypothetical protein
MRFREFLRAAVLLFGGAATLLATVTALGVSRTQETTPLYVAGVWWCLAALAGIWLGRRPTTTPGIAGLLVEARRAQTLPEQEPAAVLFNRLWPLAVLTVVAGGVGFLLPPVPAVATGYCILVALVWRNQSRAVAAIEGRDGVEFWFEKSSPFGSPKLLRLPGLRKVEPT